MAAATFQAGVRDKGQLALPVGVREALGVSPGDELEFEINDAGVVEVHGLRKIRTDQEVRGRHPERMRPGRDRGAVPTRPPGQAGPGNQAPGR